MFQLFVEHVYYWWRHTDGLIERFGARAAVAPAVKPWELRVGMVFDPSGVLWQVSEDLRVTRGLKLTVSGVMGKHACSC